MEAWLKERSGAWSVATAERAVTPRVEAAPFDGDIGPGTLWVPSGLDSVA